MALEMISTDDRERCGPHFICDECGDPITDAADGNAFWREPAPAQVAYTHKHCSRTYEARVGRQAWQPLTAFLAFLCNNTRVNMKSARETAALLESSY